MRRPNLTTRPPYLEKQQQKTNIDQQTQYPDPRKQNSLEQQRHQISGNDLFSLQIVPSLFVCAMDREHDRIIRISVDFKQNIFTQNE
jgi:hypothetical protein